MNNAFYVSCVVTALLSFCFGLYVLTQGAKRPLVRSWAAVCFSVSFWSFGLGMMAHSLRETEAYFWLRWVHYMGAIMLPVLFLHFVGIFLRINLRNALITGYLLAIFQEILSIFGFLATVKPLPPFNFYTVPLGLYIVFVLYFFSYVIYAQWLLYVRLRKAPSHMRNQIKYMFLGTSIAFCGGSTAFLPVYHLPGFPYGVYGVVIYLVAVTYAILTERLMDIELLAKEFIAKMLAFLLIALPLLAGAMSVQSMMTMTGTGLIRTVSILAVCVLSFSMSILFLRHYEDPRTRSLAQFFLLLGLWNAGELLLDFRPHVFSTLLYRAAYAVGCAVLMAWLQYWKTYFDRDWKGLVSVEKWLRYSAYLMMFFCVGTPYVLKGLTFDPSLRGPATEVAGAALPIFWAWFLLTLGLISIWTCRAFLSAHKSVMSTSSRWILASFGFGIASAVTYFKYVERSLQFPYHAFLEIGFCISLATSLFHRFGKSLWMQRKVSPWIGATCLVYPFVAGVLLTEGILWRVAGVIFMVFIVPNILREVQESVQSFLDIQIFGNQLAGRQHVLETRQQSFRLSNLRDLVDTSIQHAVQQLPLAGILLYFHNLTSNQYMCITRWPESDGTAPVFGEDDPLIESLQKGTLKENDSIVLPLGFAAVLPLRHETGLFGFLLLAQKEQALGGLRRADIEEVRQTLEHPLRYAYVFYEQSIMLDKMTHDNIRYAGNIRRMVSGMSAAFRTKMPEGMSDILVMIDHQATMMEEYLNDLRRIMAILAQRMQGQYKMEVYDAATILERILPAERVRASQQGIEFICNVDPADPKSHGRFLGWGEWHSIRHVIENLLSNAFKFTPSGGTIRLEVKDLGPNLEWVISDTGPGIPKVSIPHIFDLFYQGPGRESMEKSTGLGLSIVKEIVALHEGNIDVISEEGHGTTFYVRVPSAAGQKSKAA